MKEENVEQVMIEEEIDVSVFVRLEKLAEKLKTTLREAGGFILGAEVILPEEQNTALS